MKNPLTGSESLPPNTSSPTLKRLIFFTGKPGVGKTTALMRCVETLKGKGLRVGGMVSREVRRKGVRVGFELIDMATGELGVLAHVEQREGPRLGKYRVNLKDLVRVGVGAITKAINESDVVVIDEVGPMELFSREFKEAVVKAVNSGKLVLGTVHFKAKDPVIALVKKRSDTAILEVTAENRDKIVEAALDLALTSIQRSERESLATC